MGDSPFSRIVIPSAVEGSLRRSGILHAGGHVKIAWIIGFTLSCRLRFTGVQGRFLGFARNDETREAIILHTSFTILQKGASSRHSILRLSRAPLLQGSCSAGRAKRTPNPQPPVTSHKKITPVSSLVYKSVSSPQPDASALLPPGSRSDRSKAGATWRAGRGSGQRLRIPNPSPPAS